MASFPSHKLRLKYDNTITAPGQTEHLGNERSESGAEFPSNLTQVTRVWPDSGQAGEQHSAMHKPRDGRNNVIKLIQ